MNYHFDLIFYDKSASWASTDITSIGADGIPNFTDAGNDSFNTAKVILTNARGNGFTTGSVRIEQYDRIRIRIYDDTVTPSVIKYNKVFDIDRIEPGTTDTGGRVLTLSLIGIERYLNTKHWSRPGRFKSAWQMLKDLGDQYNAERGSQMPLLVDHDNDTGNKLPKYTINNYDFGIGPETIWNRMNEVIDKLGGSVESGGVLDFFDMRFDYDTSDPNKIYIRTFSSGNPSGSTFETLLTTFSPVETVLGGLEGEKATVINAFGDDSSGSLPTGWSKFKSGQDYFNNHPEWATGIPYKVGARVQKGGVHYKAETDHTSSSSAELTNPLIWTPVSAADEYGNVYQYSEWTVDKSVSIWANSGADPLAIHGFFTNKAMFDANIEVWDTSYNEYWFRTWVTVRAKQPSDIPSDYLYAKNSNGVYRGLRVLVDTVLGTPTGAFSGNDYKGDSFANAVAEYDSLNSRWYVKYKPTTDPTTGQKKLTVAVLHEAQVYLFNESAWENITDQANKADCFHYYYSLFNVPGIIDESTFGANENSAVEVEYRYKIPESLNTSTMAWYNMGAWLSMQFPIPVYSGNSITEYVGQIYGGGTSSLSTSIKEPALFDIQNNDWTPQGLTGWNEGSQTECLGQCSGLSFFIRLSYESSSNGVSNWILVPLEANFKMRVALIDIADNVAVQDFTLERNSVWQEVLLPFAGFTTYRGRRPREWIETIFTLPPRELDANSQFQFHLIKAIVIQTQNSYDEIGRYAPFLSHFNFAVDPSGPFPDRRVRMALDGFRFVKPLIANTGKDSTFGLEGKPVERPDITNYIQLLGDAKSELEKNKWKLVEYNIDNTSFFKIRFGDYFYHTDPYGVTYSDNGSNTVKLVAKSVEYSLTSAGITGTVSGLRRFT